MSDHAQEPVTPREGGVMARIQQTENELGALQSRLEALRQKLRGQSEKPPSPNTVQPISRGLAQLNENVARTVEACHKLLSDIESIF